LHTSLRIRRRLTGLMTGVALVLLTTVQPALADCFDDAGTYQSVNPNVLRAIAWYESKGDPTAVHRNSNGSIDVGELQINSIHFPELEAYGVSPSSLRDQCVNIYVAAWHLKQKMIKYGNTWDAIGSYHSETPRQRDQYARAIQGILASWGLVSPR